MYNLKRPFAVMVRGLSLYCHIIIFSKSESGVLVGFYCLKNFSKKFFEKGQIWVCIWVVLVQMSEGSNSESLFRAFHSTFEN